MTEQLIATLGQIQSLRTTTLRSTLPFKQTARPRTEIAKLLGVDAVLEGTLVGGSAGRRKRAAGCASSSPPEAARRCGAASFGRPRGEIGRAAGGYRARRWPARSARRSPGPRRRASRQVRSTNPAAEEAYLQGRMHLASYGPEPAPPRARSRSSVRSKSIRAMRPRTPRRRMAYLRLGGTNVLTAQRRAAVGARGDPQGVRRTATTSPKRMPRSATSSSSTTGTGAAPSASTAAASISIPGSCPRATSLRRCWRRASASTKPWRSPKRRCALDPQSIDGVDQPRHAALLQEGLQRGARKIAERVIAQEPGNPAGHLLGGTSGGSARPLSPRR